MRFLAFAKEKSQSQLFVAPTVRGTTGVAAGFFARPDFLGRGTFAPPTDLPPMRLTPCFTRQLINQSVRSDSDLRLVTISLVTPRSNIWLLAGFCSSE